jgi:intermediate cleaving peptidase 55
VLKSSPEYIRKQPNRKLLFSTSFTDVETHFHADVTQPISSFAPSLRSMLAVASHVYVDAPSPPPRKRGNVLGFLQYDGAKRGEFDAVIDGLSNSRKRPLAPEVGKMRTIKSPVEQHAMRAAAEISSKAHTKVGAGTVLV